jgi:3,4-dihydroxy 2-butanone 4-phosphate synthase/GTP cyclohydrolase II
MNPDGSMARMPQLKKFSRRHGIKIIAVKDLIAYRRRTEKLVVLKKNASITINRRIWAGYAYEDLTTHQIHLAIVLGRIDPETPTLLRAHSRCLTGDVLHSQRCDCGQQLQAAIQLIEDEGSGVVLYISSHEGRGIGLIDKLRAYDLQDHGLDTVEANEALDQPTDSRDYGIGYQILYDLGVRKMRILTNNPRKLVGVESYGIEVIEQVPIRIHPNPHNARYLATKKEKLGHLL